MSRRSLRDVLEQLTFDCKRRRREKKKREKHTGAAGGKKERVCLCDNSSSKRSGGGLLRIKQRGSVSRMAKRDQRTAGWSPEVVW